MTGNRKAGSVGVCVCVCVLNAGVGKASKHGKKSSKLMQKRLGEHMHKSGSKCPSQHP